MNNQNASGYFRGKLASYNKNYKHGYIEVDKPIFGFTKIRMNRHSIENLNTIFEAGDQVLFDITEKSDGISAIEVHLEIEDYSVLFSGVIVRYFKDRKFGFIKTENGFDVFFQAKGVSNSALPVKENSQVNFNLRKSKQGLVAYNISKVESQAKADDWLARAMLAKDRLDHDAAIELYEEGLKHSPELQLILSYAAMLKSFGRMKEAKRVFSIGASKYSSNPKLYVDFARLLLTVEDFEEATNILKLAVSHSKKSSIGEKQNIFSMLGRAFYHLGTESDLKQAIKYYQKAAELASEAKLERNDEVLFALAKVRTRHYLGDEAVLYFSKHGLEIVTANLIGDKENVAEFLLRVREQEFQESYGLDEFVYARIYFDSTVTARQLSDFDKKIKEVSKTGLMDGQVSFVVFEYLAENLEKHLWKRIEDKKGERLSMVPITKEDFRNENETQGLRSILDAWLYRRDLFAGNRAVVGRNFFGRNKSLAALRDSIEDGISTGIFGLRKVGKTSLLQESKRRAIAIGDVAIYIDLLRVPADSPNCNWIYWKMANELKDQLYSNFGQLLFNEDLNWRLASKFDDLLDIPIDFPVATAFDSDLTRAFKIIENLNLSNNSRIIFLFDEIERLIPIGKSSAINGAIDFLGYLRGVNQENEDFVVVVAGANALINEIPQIEERDNPVFNFFRELYLPLLEYQEVETMVRNLGAGMGIKFNKAAIELIFSLTGGHPFITKQFCSYLAEQVKQRPLKITAPLVSKHQDVFVDVKESDFKEIVARLGRDFPDELRLYRLIASNGGKLTIHETRESATGTNLKHLIGYQLVTVENDLVISNIKMMDKWIASEYRK